MAGLTALRLILGFSIVSTATHYTHNFVAVDDYPGGGPALQVAIVLSWPALTAIGLYGYRLYTEGRFRFEAISTAEERKAVMGRIADYLLP